MPKHNHRDGRRDNHRHYSRKEVECNPKLKQHEPSRTIAVFNVHFKTKEREIRERFERFGEIEKLAFIRHPATKKFMGYAFITFNNLDDAKAAAGQTEKIRFRNREVVINFSMTQEATGRLRQETEEDQKQETSSAVMLLSCVAMLGQIIGDSMTNELHKRMTGNNEQFKQTNKKP